MKGLLALIRRNVKIFFKDKGMFFSSLITPVILLVLYGTFLGRVYRENFLSAIPAGVHIPESLLNGLVGGQLISSILAVSCVTVAFCSNMLMVQDKVSGARADLMVTPVRRVITLRLCWLRYWSAWLQPELASFTCPLWAGTSASGMCC